MGMLRLWVLVVVVVVCSGVVCTAGVDAGHGQGHREDREEHSHGDNWAVIVSTSMYWHNYRHTSNALVFYHHVKRLGIPDSNILLLIGDDHACNPRNARPATIHAVPGLRQHNSVYDEEIEVDYRGTEVTADTFIRLMTGRVSPSLPASKRLRSGPDSNIFVFMTGHGGVDFLKFRDTHVITGAELGDIFYTMHEKRRYKQIFFVLETCHAESMLEHIRSPNILSIGSSSKHEDSYSLLTSPDLGVMLVDEFTGAAMRFLSRIEQGSRATVADLFMYIRRSRLHSRPVLLTRMFSRDPSKVLLSEFLASTPAILALEQSIQQQLPSIALSAP